jgi:outer membrane receptor protein involved in Fe transport
MEGEITEATLPEDLGLKISRVPKWSMTSSLTIEAPLFAQIEGSLTVSYAGQRDGFQTFNNAIALPDSDVFGLQLALTRDDWRLGLNVTNLTDTKSPIGARTAQGEARERDPRAFMLVLSRSFGEN